MKQLILLFIGLVCTMAFTGQDSLITWKHDIQLDWSDFTQRVGQGGVFKAFTYSGIRYEVRDYNGTIQIDVAAYFLPDESWAFQDFLNPELLAHEQFHFHITELYARRMRQEFREFEVGVEQFIEEHLIEKLKDLFNSIYDEMENTQKEYDEDTSHGTKQDVQDKWQATIEGQLKSTEVYALPSD